jgi:hypothetical protein
MSVKTSVTVPEGWETAVTRSILCRDADSCNVGEPNDAEAEPSYSAAMQSITTSKEASMFRKHLIRLNVMVITGSILVAAYVEPALAAKRFFK